MSAQTNRPAFQVASVKPGDPQSIQYRLLVSPGGRLIGNNITLRMLIQEAYQLRPFQLTGGPRWMDSDKFEVNAKGESSATIAETRLMLQSLLADRFQLTMQRETKVQPVSILTVRDKEKLKLQPAQAGARYTVETRASGRGALSNHVVFKSTSMARLADVLSRQLGHMVEDETGLSGEFDFEFDADRDENEPNPFIAPYAPVLPQLGLKLESRKGPVEIFIVDRAEKPSEN